MTVQTEILSTETSDFPKQIIILKSIILKSSNSVFKELFSLCGDGVVICKLIRASTYALKHAFAVTAVRGLLPLVARYLMNQNM